MGLASAVACGSAVGLSPVSPGRTRLLRGFRQLAGLGVPAAEQSLRDLVQAVHVDGCEVACCRIVSHMPTTDSQPVEFAGVRVEPVISEAADHDRQLLRIISAVIARASSAYGRDRPYDFAPPESVVIVRASGSKPFDLVKPLSQRIKRGPLPVGPAIRAA